MRSYGKTYSYKIKAIDSVFEIRFINSGKKWQTALRRLFETYFTNYLTKDRTLKAFDVIHLVDKKQSTTDSKRHEYVVPLKKGDLDKIGFGYLLKDIFLNHTVGMINKKGGLCVHASVAVRNGEAVFFVGPSGVGKSTITKLVSPDLETIADDTIFVAKEKQYVAYQPFWFEKQVPIYKRMPVSYPIKAICFLKQSKKNEVLVESNKQAVIEHMASETIYLDPRIEFGNLIDFINSGVPFYWVNFSLDGKIRGKIMKALF